MFLVKESVPDHCRSLFKKEVVVIVVVVVVVRNF
jgi:hypothetical protein